jgi:tetratricopeptide (TPR) repeat protein
VVSRAMQRRGGRASAYALLAGLVVCVAAAADRGESPSILVMPLEVDPALVSQDYTETSILTTALNQACQGGAWQWDPEHGSVYGAIIEKRLTREQALAFQPPPANTPQAAADAAAIIYRFASALTDVGACVYGCVLNDDRALIYDLYYIDMETGKVGRCVIHERDIKVPISQEATRRVIDALDAIRAGGPMPEGDSEPIAVGGAPGQGAGAPATGGPAPGGTGRTAPGGGGTTAPAGPGGTGQGAGGAPGTRREGAAPGGPAAGGPGAGGATAPRTGVGGTLPPPRDAVDTHAFVASEDPGAEAFYNEALTLAQQNEIERALALLQKAQRLDPASVPIALEVADAYRRMQDPVNARQAYEHVLELDPPNPVARARIIRMDEEAAAASVGGSATATALPGDIPAAKAAADAQPNNADLQHNAALLYERSGDYARALRYYENAAGIRVSDVPTQRKIGQMNVRLGDYTRAKAAFEQILRWDPKEYTAHEELGQLYMNPDFGDRDAAVAFDHFAQAAERWTESYHLEPRPYLAAVDSTEKGLVVALDSVRDGLTGLSGALLGGEGTGTHSRETLYETAAEADAAAKRACLILGKLQPLPSPPEAAEMQRRYLVAARLASQSFVNLLLALDAGDKADLEMAVWGRERAITELGEAAKLRDALDAEPTGRGAVGAEPAGREAL